MAVGAPARLYEKLDGKILVWWDVEEEDVEKIKQQTGLSEIIGLKTVLESEAHKFRKRLEKYEEWAKELFQALKGIKKRGILRGISASIRRLCRSS